MTIQIHFEWRKINLDATVAQFINSKYAPENIRENGVDGAREFLINRLKKLLKDPSYFQLPENLSVPFVGTFEIYNSVWFTTYIRLTELSGNDRTMGQIKELNVLSRLDAGHLEELVVEFLSTVTGTLGGSSHFLTLLK